MPIRYNAHASSGTLDTLVAGTTTGGTAVAIGDNTRQKVRALSALVTVDAETNTITIAAKWQVSNDNSTWVDVANGSQNAAAVVLATGTGGADASVTRVIPAPDSVYGWRYARVAVVNGVVTGNAVDTYSMSYSYRVGN